MAAALARRLDRIAPLVEPDRERAQARERIGLRVDDRADVVVRFTDGLLEQGEHELVLAVEVLVEAAERLLRAVDDFLDGELGRALLVDELERGVEEALRALLGAGAGRGEASRNRAFAPGRTVLAGLGVDSCHVSTVLSLGDRKRRRSGPENTALTHGNCPLHSWRGEAAAHPAEGADEWVLLVE